MTRNALPGFIESTAGQVAAELARRGIAADQRVTITIGPRTGRLDRQGAEIRTSQGNRRRLE